MDTSIMPERVGLANVEIDALKERLNKVRKFAAVELKNHLTALEREANKEVFQTEQLKADHEESVELAKVVLRCVEGAAYTDYLEWQTISEARSDVRKLQTNHPKSREQAKPTTLADLTAEQLVKKLRDLGDAILPLYESGMIESEKFDNGELKLTVEQLARANCRMNFCGMIVPSVESPGFLFSWRENLVRKHRSPDREMDGLI